MGVVVLSVDRFLAIRPYLKHAVAVGVLSVSASAFQCSGFHGNFIGILSLFTNSFIS